MNVLSLAAVALGDEIERFGSYFGYAAIIGLGVLSLLYFSQAREVKRLREWAGRAPERDAELAQRVQAGADQRRVVAQPVQQPVPVQPVTPQTVAAQQADAARKAAAAAVMQKFQPPGTAPPPPGQLTRPPLPGAPGAPVPAGATARAPGQPGTPLPAGAAVPQPVPGVAGAAVPQPVPGVAAPGSAAAAAHGVAATPAGAPVGAPAATPAAPGTVPPASGPGVASPQAGPAVPPNAATAGAVAAARQAAIASRSPVAANGAGSAPPAAPPPSPPPDLPPRPPRTVTPASPSDRGSGRRIGLIAGGGAAAVAAVVLLVVLLSGGSDKPPADNAIGNAGAPPPAAAPPAASAPKVDRKATKVAVLNGTTQDGLAGSVAGKIEQKGFTILSKGNNADQAVATTTVSYASGSAAAARIVARIVGVSVAAVQPIDTNTAAAVAPETRVVVIVGNNVSSTG